MIYVPTVKGAQVPGKNRTAHDDQVMHCFIVVNNAVREIDATASGKKFLQKWIGKYKDRRAAFFNSDGNGYANKGAFYFGSQKDFVETESIWYNMKSIKNGKDGLLEFLECASNNVTQVNAQFAGYPGRRKNYGHQMTLVFDLISPNKNLAGKTNFLVAYKGNGNKDNTPSDTGKPCPPPNGGCQAEGATLPSQQ